MEGNHHTVERADRGTDTDQRGGRLARGALTAAAFGAGLMASAGVATASNDDTGIVHGTDYRPNGDFDILAELATQARNEFFEQFDEDEEIFIDPTDWEVYSIQFDTDDSRIQLGHLLIDTDDTDVEIEPGDSGTMEDDGSFRSTDRNLIELTIDF